MGLLDRAIALAEDLAPEWGLRRATARARREILAAGYGYHGASRTKKALLGWQTATGGPDADIVDELPTLRERSRDLFMGEALAAGALKTIRTNEIGAGLRLNANVDAGYLGLSVEQAQAWEDQAERLFWLWASSKSCDASQRCSFGELQGLARLSWLMSGDVFALTPAIPRPGDPFALRVLLVEGDRVCDPDRRPTGADILGGVEVGPLGEPRAYWIRNSHPGDTLSHHLRLVNRAQWSRVPAFGERTGRPLVLHLMESERPGQRRGVPILAPVIESLKQLSRYSHAELMAAVVSGFFTAAITSEQPQTPLGQVLPPQGTGTDHDRVDDADASSYELGNGALLGLAPGEHMEAVNPTRPNSNFDGFVQSVCRQIGAGVGVPYELLMMQFTASYSASRGALLEAWKRFHVGRSWFAAGFCQPIYEAWLEEAIARGYLSAPGFFADPVARAAWSGAEWIGPTQGQLDPTKEVEAAARRVAEGFSTRTREARELTGGDFWEYHPLRVREEAARRDGDLVATVEPPAPAETQQTTEEMAA